MYIFSNLPFLYITFLHDRMWELKLLKWRNHNFTAKPFHWLQSATLTWVSYIEDYDQNLMLLNYSYMLSFNLIGELSTLNKNIEGMYFEQISLQKVINIKVICIIFFSHIRRNVSDDMLDMHSTLTTRTICCWWSR